jgi:uncharacterized protein YkwD
MIENTQPLNHEELRAAIVAEHNRLRADPHSYIAILEKEIENFKEKILHRPGETPIQTNEGKEAYLAAIEFLRTQSPVAALESHEALNASATDHASDIGPRGVVSYESSDNKNLSDRIDKHAEWEVAIGENLDFGAKKAEHVLINLLVDDGVENRHKRKHIFNPNYKFIGVGIHEHKEYEVAVVVDYAGGIREKGTPFYDYRNYKFDYEKFVKENPKDKKPKTSYQRDDADAPYDTKSVRIVKESKLWEGRYHKITKKYYTLNDGSIHIVEVEDV